MNEAQWQALMTRWNAEMLDSEYADELPEEVLASGWLGYPGASEEQLAQAEARLGRKLPPSYREFLKLSNGWEMPTPFIYKLWSAEEIEWLSVRHQHDLIDPWLAGVGEEQLDDVPGKHLQGALEISDYGDGIFLLNPQVVTAEGEWEAWFLASWIPGARRYPSFWEMMQAEHESFLDLKAHEEKRLHADDDPAVLVAKLPGLIEGLDEKIEHWRAVTEKNPMMPDYNEGTIEGFEVARSRILELQAQSRDPRVLRDRLLGLADELETRGQQIQSSMQLSSLSTLLSFNLSKMVEQIREGGLASGYQQAAGQIRWFLNEETF